MKAKTIFFLRATTDKSQRGRYQIGRCMSVWFDVSESDGGAPSAPVPIFRVSRAVTLLLDAERGG